MEVKHHALIEEALCKDLDEYETKLKQGHKLQPQDYAALHDIYSALAKRETYIAMKESEEYGDYEPQEGGMSGTRMTYSGMRPRMMSRDGYPDGYDRGYSGHYPMPYYPGRW